MTRILNEKAVYLKYGKFFKNTSTFCPRFTSSWIEGNPIDQHGIVKKKKATWKQANIVIRKRLNNKRQEETVPSVLDF